MIMKLLIEIHHYQIFAKSLTELDFRQCSIKQLDRLNLENESKKKAIKPLMGYKRKL